LRHIYRFLAWDTYPGQEMACLRWKVWSLNEPERAFGGIYLFEDGASADAYLAGPIVAHLRQHPALRDITAKQFDVLEKCGVVTPGHV
jgi:hypothetical protein